MKVLWFAATPSLYDEGKVGGWIASLERVMRQHCRDIKLGIAFTHTDRCFKKEVDTVTYYPLNVFDSKADKLRAKFDPAHEWRLLKPKVLQVVEDFEPDVIHCFGSEWPYADIASDINIPIVIHMQGFLNAYGTGSSLALSTEDWLKCQGRTPINILKNCLREKRDQFKRDLELEIMGKNRYFMGRTQWDKSIVKHYSKDGVYFHCEEVIRPEIYNSQFSWSFQKQNKMKLITVSQASELKGNEIILRTADILKNHFHFEFVWKVAGNKDCFRLFEKKTGIQAEAVNIELLGFIDAETIAKELSEAQMYIHPSIIDNSPNSLCEAQLIGCPVVSTNVGGISQLVEDGKTGRMYPYNEPHTLAFLIMDLFNNEQALTFLSENEKKISRKRHDPEVIAEAVREIYDTVIRSAQ